MVSDSNVSGRSNTVHLFMSPGEPRCHGNGGPLFFVGEVGHDHLLTGKK